VRGKELFLIRFALESVILKKDFVYLRTADFILSFLVSGSELQIGLKGVENATEPTFFNVSIFSDLVKSS